MVPIKGLPALLRMAPTALTDMVAQVASSNDAANSYLQMFYVGMALDQSSFALEMQAMALEHRRLYRIKGPDIPKVRLLAIMGPGNMLDNTPLDLLIENTGVRLDVLFIRPGDDLPATLPDHDIAFVAIGEGDKSAALLSQVGRIVDDWPRPVLNPPSQIQHCARDTCYRLLKDIEGLLVPRTWRHRVGEDCRFEFPVTIRPIDTHGGNGMARVNDPLELAHYFASVTAAEYYVAQYIDYQSPDGKFRKIRIVLIEGKPYICHLAISDSWIVHYLSAGMDTSADKREEEAQLMQTFDTGFASKYQRPIEATALQLGLDYVTIDCAELADGRLLIFEVDSRGLVHAQDSVELYPYKPPVMQKAFDAFEAMLIRRVQSAASL
jgi:glutathione synthase/RimK-type ligase-like ATP-grasp enzyme